MMKILALVLLVAAVRGDDETGQTTTETQLQFEIQPQLKINKYQKPIVLNKLSDNVYGIKSDNVLILNDKTVLIPKLYYNGNAPDAHVSIGNGSYPQDDGITITGLEALPAYYGQDVTAELPDNLTVDNTDWLAIWCSSLEKPLAYVLINPQQYEYPPQILGFQDIVKSSPIVLVNKKTLFIPNLVYDGNYLDTHFWVGNGTEPTSDGVLVPDEYGSVENLGYYQHENIYINLPQDITTDNIDYVAVWSKSEEISLGHVQINHIISVPETIGYETETIDGKMIMRVPKCCPISTIPSFSSCVYNNTLRFQPTLSVYKHNATHLDNETMDMNNFKYEPYVYSMICPSVKYALGDDYENVALLQNGSLIVTGTGMEGILSQGDYCLDIVEDDDNYAVRALVCAPENKISLAMLTCYTTLLIISILCFAGISILYWLILRPTDVHKKCFLCYSSWMCVTFIFLAIAQIFTIENTGCAIIGFFFQFSMISSFSWLAILCIDINYMLKCTLDYVSNRDENENRAKTSNRFKYYLTGSIGVPIICLFISLVRNQVPDIPDSFFKPQYGRNSCYFKQEEQRRILFYVPIVISICLSIFYLIWAKLKITYGDKHYQNNFFWIDDGKPYKFMHRRYILMLIPMLIWLIEGIVAFGGPNDGIKTAFDIIEASQGIFIFLLFVLNQEAKQQIIETIEKQKRKRNRGDEGFPMKTFIPNTNNIKNNDK